MKILKEITQWDTEFPLKNHIYFVTDNRERMVGYVREGHEPFRFKTPLPFYAKGRKFVEVKNTYGFTVDNEPAEETRGVTYTVAGSKANVYTVSNDSGAWTCTCPASKWQRGDCKHVKLIREQQAQ